jgi:nucleotide-binding universal stress UspA family protein
MGDKSGPLVVGYDGRPESERALEHALAEAPKRNADLVVVVVAGIPYETTDPYQLGSVDFGLSPPIPPEGPVEVQPILAEARRRLDDAGAAGTVEWALGDPVTEILRVATERDASAIVVGEHHHSRLGQLLGADTANELVRRATCDVLVAH